MRFGKRIPEDGTMRKISSLIAIQTCIRRACFIACEFTGIEVMPEEMGAASVDSMSRLKRAWDCDKISSQKPESVVNFAATMACAEWAYSVKKISDAPYTLNADTIANQFDLLGQTLDGLFPGIMGMKTASQSIYDGVCKTAESAETNGFSWTKKLNEPMVCLISLFLILKIMSHESTKINEIKEALQTKKEEG